MRKLAYRKGFTKQNMATGCRAAIPHGKKTHCEREAGGSSGQRALALLTSLTHSGSHLTKTRMQIRKLAYPVAPAAKATNGSIEAGGEENMGQLVASDQSVCVGFCGW